jgi:hypothetical protein
MPPLRRPKRYHALAVIGALLIGALGAPNVQSAAMPLQNTSGAPVTPPSTDPHWLGGTWAPASGSMGTKGLPKDLKPGLSPPTNSWDSLPMRESTETLLNLLITLSAQDRPLATPHLTCRPNGIAGLTTPKFPVVIVQSDDELFILMEEDRDVFRVYLNRNHPAHLKPSYDGDAVGHWDGNTLVVDTIGYNGLGMLDENWHPFSEKAHLIERFTKSKDGKSLDIDVMLEDPVYYTKPLHMRDRWNWAAGERQLEDDCAENAPDGSLSFEYTDPRFKPICTAGWDAQSSTNKVTCQAAPAAASPNHP